MRKCVQIGISGLVCLLLLHFVSQLVSSQDQNNSVIESMCWNADGSQLIVGRGQSFISIFDLNGKFVTELQLAPETPPSFKVDLAVCHPADPDKLLVRVVDAYSVSQQTEQFLVDLSANSLSGSLVATHFEQVNSIAWQPNSHLAAISGRLPKTSIDSFGEFEYWIEVWDTLTNTLVQSFKELPSSVAWTPDGKHLISVNLYRIAIRETTGWAIVSSIPISTPANGSGRLILSPDGSKLAFTEGFNFSHVSAIQVWDMSTQRFLMRYKSEDIRDIAWNPDGQYLAVLDLYGSVDIIDPRSGRVVTSLLDDVEEITAIAWDHTSNRLAYAYVDADDLSGQIGLIELSNDYPSTIP